MNAEMASAIQREKQIKKWRREGSGKFS